jgi:hypothetical protein
VYTVKDKVRNLLLTALLDTGSVRSFISTDYFSRLQLNDPKLRLFPSDIRFRSASVQTLQALRYVTVFLKMGRFS